MPRRSSSSTRLSAQAAMPQRIFQGVTCKTFMVLTRSLVKFGGGISSRPLPRSGRWVFVGGGRAEFFALEPMQQLDPLLRAAVHGVAFGLLAAACDQLAAQRIGGGA